MMRIELVFLMLSIVAHRCWSEDSMKPILSLEAEKLQISDNCGRMLVVTEDNIYFENGVVSRDNFKLITDIRQVDANIAVVAMRPALIAQRRNIVPLSGGRLVEFGSFRLSGIEQTGFYLWKMGATQPTFVGYSRWSGPHFLMFDGFQSRDGKFIYGQANDAGEYSNFIVDDDAQSATPIFPGKRLSRNFNAKHEILINTRSHRDVSKKEEVFELEFLKLSGESSVIEIGNGAFIDYTPIGTDACCFRERISGATKIVDLAVWPVVDNTWTLLIPDAISSGVRINKQTFILLDRSGIVYVCKSAESGTVRRFLLSIDKDEFETQPQMIQSDNDLFVKFKSLYKISIKRILKALDLIDLRKP